MPHKTLQQYFGYQNFRPGQIEIINSILNKKDTLAILPTGGGKSICFQIPGLILPGTTLVVSPLISLMQDQVETLKSKNISATFINSSLSQKQIKTILNNLKTYKFIYLAPERLKNNKFLLACEKINISLVAIDEAHCISMWGHDFRPSYKKITDFINKLKNKPLIAAFTATATDLVKKDIINLLDLKNPTQFTKSFKRNNLTLHNIDCQSNFNKDLFLFRLLKKHQGQAGIIYASTRYSVENLVDLINHHYPQLNCLGYHGGMDNKTRALIQEKFLKNQTNLIVATNAFGMGVDKSNIRFVIHYQIPGNLENYYQEAGRAGRDGLASFCYLLFHDPDLKIQIEFIKSSKIEKTKKINTDKLKNIIKFAQTKTCLNQKILSYFGEKNPNPSCKLCSKCLKLNPEKPTGQEIITQEKLNLIIKLLASIYQIPKEQIMTEKIKQQLALFNPQTKKDFLKLAGIGQGWVEKWFETIHKNLI
jgi:ATP-dependent DNA helicase RecQ